LRFSRSRSSIASSSKTSSTASGKEADPAGAGSVGGRLAAWTRVALVALGVAAVDQLSKQLIEHNIAAGEEHKFLPGIELVNTRNRGVAFGFLPGSHTGVTILIGVALLGLLAYFARHYTRALIWLPTGMLLGGALGNIVDRARQGSVTDFVKLPLGWPPFNLADVSITLGILLLLAVGDRSRRPSR
jgi:signal peptidase II